MLLDLDKIDPDWKFAATHGQASKIGIKKDENKRSTTSICRCCLNVIYKDPAPLCENSKELEFLGFGLPLYYVFLKNCIILLLISICSYNGLSLYWAFLHNYDWCHSDYQDHHRLLASDHSAPVCHTFMVQMSRVEPQVSMEEQLLRIISFIIHLGFLIYMRDKIIKLESYYDERTTSLSDYAVILKNIPPQKNLQSKLREFLKKQFSEEHQVKQLTLLPKYQQIEHLREEKLSLINQLRPYYQKQDIDNVDCEKIQKDILELQNQIQNEAKRMAQLAKSDEMESERAILIFQTDDEKQKVIQEFQNIDVGKRGPYFGVGSEEITLKQAPEPKQIIWENMNVERSKKVFYRFIGWFLSLLVLVVVTIIFYFVMESKALNLIDAIEGLDTHPDDEDYQRTLEGAVALVYIMLILIVLFNKLLMVVLFHKFTDMQRSDTSSKFQFSFGLKYCLGLFFTTAVMTLAVEAVRFNNYYSHLYGVIDEETVMFFFNALFVPLFWLINPVQLVKICKRKLKYGRRDLTQKEANELMEDSEYMIGKRYAQIIETMWFTFLYSTIIPIGAIISFFGLIFYYWVDKYNLLRRSTLPIEVQGRLVKFTMKLLDITLILKPIGEIIFDMQVRHGNWTVGSIVMLVIGFFYLIIPMNKLLGAINPEKFYLEEKTYEDVKSRFKDTYHSLHPTYAIANRGKISQKLVRAGISFDKQENPKFQSNIGLSIELGIQKTPPEENC